MFRHLMLLFLLMLAPAALVAEEPTPLAQTQAAFEETRDDEHRERMQLTWDESEPPMPESLVVEELVVLRDVESLPHLQRLVGELREGCSPRAAVKGPTTAPLPWLGQYQVDGLEKRLTLLSTPASP